MASKGQKFRKWSKEEKLRIVKRHLDEHISLSQLSEQESVSKGMLSNWVKRYAEQGEAGLEQRRRGNPYAALHTKKDLNEVERLKLELLKLQIENARLKKGYYVEGDGVNEAYVTIGERITKLSKK